MVPGKQSAVTDGQGDCRHILTRVCIALHNLQVHGIRLLCFLPPPTQAGTSLWLRVRAGPGALCAGLVSSTTAPLRGLGAGRRSSPSQPQENVAIRAQCREQARRSEARCKCVPGLCSGACAYVPPEPMGISGCWSLPGGQSHRSKPSAPIFTLPRERPGPWLSLASIGIPGATTLKSLLAAPAPECVLRTSGGAGAQGHRWRHCVWSELWSH